MKRVNAQAARKRRGVGLIIFLLMIVPAFIFAAGFGIDLSNMVTTYNYGSNMAQAAVNAGTTARDTATGRLNGAEAANRANDICRKMSASSRRPMSGCDQVSVSDYSITVGVRTILSVQVSRFIKLPTTAQLIDYNNYAPTAFATASVCNSLESVGSSDLYCVRPGG